MAKTVRKYYVDIGGQKQARALVELDHADLAQLDVLEPSWSSSGAFVKDPGEALTGLCAFHLKAASRVVLEGGLVEVARQALERLKEWTEKARTVRKAPLGIWSKEDDPGEGPKEFKTKCRECGAPLDVTSVICGACVDKDKKDEG